MFRICFFLFFIVSTTADDYYNIINNVSECLNQILEKYKFHQELCFMYEKNEISQGIITSIMDKEKKLFRLIDDRNISTERWQKSYYSNDIIVIIKKFKTLKKFFRSPYWNPKGKILILIYDHLDAKEVIEKVWNSTKSINVTIMKIFNGRVHFYTWFPYKKEECEKVMKITHIDEWKNGSFAGNHDLFPKKLPEKFSGCPLYVTTTVAEPFVLENYQDGYEIRIIKTIAQFHNFTIRYLPVPEGENFWHLNSSTAEFGGAFHWLMKNKADLVFGAQMTRSDRINITDILYPHIHENMLWIFAAPGRKSNFASIYKIFSLKLWLWIVFNHFMVTLAFYYVTNTARIREPDTYRNFISCFFTSLAIISNMAVTKPRGFFLRFITMVYVIYALHITTAYQSTLIVDLTHQEIDEPYESVQEIIDDGLTCYITSSGRNVYINVTDHDLWNQILQPGKFKYMKGDDFRTKLKDEVAFNKTAFMLFSRSNIEFTTTGRYQDRNGKSLFTWLPFLAYTVCFYISPGNPLQGILTNTILKFKSAGLIDFWIKSINQEHGTVSLRDDDDVGDQQELQPLSIRHLEGAFLFYFIFSMCSVVVFLFEVIFYHKFNKK